MKVLITGAGGQLGAALGEELRREAGVEVTAAARGDLDITRETRVLDAVRSLEPRWIINCAAYTDVEKAELEPERAYLVNDRALGTLADAALENGARLIHISTDYVFSGEFPGTRPRPYHEDDAPAPLNVYGASKLAGEMRLRTHPAHVLILRTSWLFGGGERNFLAAMLRLGREALAGGPRVKVVSDETGTPTDCWSLAAQIARLLRAEGEGLRGVVHAAAGGETTRYDLARAIFRAAGWKLTVEPIPAAAYPSRARRPAYSALENRRLDRLGLNTMPPWQEGLRRAMARRR